MFLAPWQVKGVLVYYEKEEDLGPLVLGSCPIPQFLLQHYQPPHSVLRVHATELYPYFDLLREFSEV